MDTIPRQVRLPLRAAVSVAVQGIRIRLGRSAVTLSGIALGIAFLASILAGATIKRGVAAEDELRRDSVRMLGFLTSETGPLDQRTIGLIVPGPLSENERRLLRSLDQEGIQQVNIYGNLPDGIFRRAKTEQVRALPETGVNASAIIVLGDGPIPTLDPDSLFRQSHRPVLAFTRTGMTRPEAEKISMVQLTRPPRSEELAARAAAERRERFRRNWIVAVSLLVTVMGIANAMLMSVTERFREIGTMKCLGALSSFIRRQFLIESMILGLAGSFLGALLGASVAILHSTLSYGPFLVFAALRAEAAFLAITLPLAFLAGIGLSILAALYPATVAARMLPATALRTNI